MCGASASGAARTVGSPQPPCEIRQHLCDTGTDDGVELPQSVGLAAAAFSGSLHRRDFVRAVLADRGQGTVSVHGTAFGGGICDRGSHGVFPDDLCVRKQALYLPVLYLYFCLSDADETDAAGAAPGDLPDAWETGIYGTFCADARKCSGCDMDVVSDGKIFVNWLQICVIS